MPRLTSLALGVGLVMAPAGIVQAMSWQMAPTCNTITVVGVTDHGPGLFDVQAVDDECGVRPASTLTGLATVSPDGQHVTVTLRKPGTPEDTLYLLLLDLPGLSGSWQSSPGVARFVP